MLLYRANLKKVKKKTPDKFNVLILILKKLNNWFRVAMEIIQFYKRTDVTQIKTEITYLNSTVEC